MARWSGLEARALREAKRMSVREFAAHLGVNVGAVSGWEKRGARAQLRYETQQMLDADLAGLDGDDLRRLHLILGGRESPPPEHDDLAGASTESWSAPNAGGADRHGLGERSARRTKSLAAAVRAGLGMLAFVAPTGAVVALRRFLDSTSRVYVVTGPPGCGKTMMVGHLASELAGEVDSQIHAVDSWPPGQLDLPSQVLRYASIPGGADPLLTLERQVAGLDRDLLVVIDGIGSREQLHEVGRQIDVVLRQVSQVRLRFVLVVRTPPDPDLTAHPVLAACVHEQDSRDSGVSFRLGRWQPEQAQQVWDAAREPGQPTFADLPPSLQQLATLPLYLTLLYAGGRTVADRPATAFHLVDHCVRRVLSKAGIDVAAATETLSDLALRASDTLLPPSLSTWLPPTTGGSGLLLPDDLSPLVVASPTGPHFTHDVIGEYFIAVRIADLLMRQGRSVASVSALNDLAEYATTSASARGIFEFVVSRLDDRDPHLAAAIALSPTVAVDTTLPLMLRAAAPGVGVATTQVVQHITPHRRTERAQHHENPLAVGLAEGRGDHRCREQRPCQFQRLG
ncbi:MAG TPA: hypothetical protein VIS06_08295, partial [Mycobacteriales bacterium]